MKAKTMCRSCHQYGHWADDPICPTGHKKGTMKGKGSTSSTASTAPSKGGKSGSKSHGGAKGDKQRTVYFTINEYGDGYRGDGQAHMMIADDARTADEMLDAMIAEVTARQVAERGADGLQAQHQNIVAGTLRIEDILPQLSPRSQRARNAYFLDLYLEVVNNPEDPE